MRSFSKLDGLFERSGEGPLSGLLVADFGRVLAGPYCTMMLADMGATVVKVESPNGDETRHWMPPIWEGVSTYFLSVNRNKLSVKLDLSDATDLSAARELAERADVVVQNFMPGKLKRFELDFDSVHRTNPSVVFASISGFGSAAGAHLPGYDLLVQAASGLMSLTGSPGEAPYRAGVAVVDVITGMHACIGILAALRHREATGKGQHVEVNLMSSALSGLVNQSGAFAIAGITPERMGNAHPSIYPYEPVTTLDGDLVLAIGNDRQFRILSEELGMADLSNDPRFATAPDRSLHRQDLRPILTSALSTRTADEWFRTLSAAGVPCAPIQDVAAGVKLAEQLGLAPIAHVGKECEGVPGIRNPIEFSLTPPTYDKPPPALGADTELFRRWLRQPSSRQPSKSALLEPTEAS